MPDLNTDANVGTGSPDPTVMRLVGVPQPDPQQVPSTPVPGAVAKNEALYVVLWPPAQDSPSKKFTCPAAPADQQLELSTQQFGRWVAG